ncbi:hypothetical protein QOT17_006216 [Balamuthia mandrillaris]
MLRCSAALFFFLLCCSVLLLLSHSATVAQAQAAKPGNASVFFDRVVLTDSFYGDYGLRKADVNQDGRMDLVAFAWQTGLLAWFENPSWRQHNVGKYPGIVDVDFADMNEDGLLDFVVAWDLHVPPVSPNEGQAGWLVHPSSNSTSNDTSLLEGEEEDERWEYRPIADATNYVAGIHRIRVGRFLKGGSDKDVIVIPIFDYGVGPQYFNQSGCSIRYFARPEDAATRTTAWNTNSTLLNSSLHICHTVRSYSSSLLSASSKEASAAQQDFLIINSLEGITRLDVRNDASSSSAFAPKARLTNLNPGKAPVAWSPFHGSQGTSLGFVDGRPAFMAQISPWEGVNVLSPATVAILLPSSSSSSIFQPPLQRIELDVLGPQAHDVVAADFNGDGCDDFLVGLRGPVIGVWMFECHKKKNNKKLELEWTFYPVSLDQRYGASALVAHDFDGDGKMDWAATGFPGFPENEEEQNNKSEQNGLLVSNQQRRSTKRAQGNHYVAVYYQR